MSSSSSDYKFAGWGAFGPDSIQGKFKWFEYEPKQFADDDVDIKIQYCGICASDLHTASSGWGDMSKMYPQVVGHEIVGEVVRVGPKVEGGIKVGDIVGVGAQCDSCLNCHSCQSGSENYCSNGMVSTYGAVFKRTSPGTKSFGGYANYWRGPSHFTVPIPSNLDPAAAAPMLCGGVTVYSPLVQYGAGSTARDVGVIGIGGLGHFAILFAKALGANVTAITHSERKVEDAKALGASNVIITHGHVDDAVKGHERSLDLLLCSSNDPKMPLGDYLRLLRPGGTFILVGAPETDALPNIHPFELIMNNVHIGGSLIGSPSRIREMLEFAASHDVKPWIKSYPMSQVNKAVPSMHAGEARYRYVLVNEENGGVLGESKL